MPSTAHCKTSVRSQRKLSVFGKKIFAQDPVGIKNEVTAKWTPFIDIAVLNDASHLHVRHGKSFRKIANSLRLYNRLVVRLSFKVNDTAVRSDGSSFDVENAALVLDILKLDVRVLSSLLFQYLDSHVVVLARLRIITVHLPVQDNRWRSWSLRLGGHFEFVGRDRRPICGQGFCAQKEGKSGQNRSPTREFHGKVSR